jgi:ketosteroid isomerase-like protein
MFPITDTDSLAAVQRWMDALLSGGRPPDLGAFWTPDATVTVPPALPYGGSYGLDEFGVYGGRVMAAWDLRPEPPVLRAAGDHVYADAVWDATARATGMRVRQPLLEVFVVRDGLIASDTLFYFDTAEVVAALEG